MAEWFSRLERRPVTPEVEGSSPFSVATMPLVMRGIIFAAVAQSVERILGKDEVTSSNLVSSSKKACDRNDYRLFCFIHYSPISSVINAPLCSFLHRGACAYLVALMLTVALCAEFALEFDAQTAFTL